MDNQDKIFNKIKEASNKAENQDFPSMDKVWSRVEEKLDQKVQKKATKTWRKIAVAASLLLLFSIGYQFFKSDAKLITPDNDIVSSDKNKELLDQTHSKEEDIVTTKIVNPNIKNEAEIILKKQLEEKVVIASNDNFKSNKAETNAYDTVNYNFVKENSKKIATQKSVPSSGHFFKTKIYEAVAVRHSESEEYATAKEEKASQASPAQAQKPLVVIDGKAITSKKNENAGIDKLSEVNDDIQKVVFLKEPLYIINGVRYSEEELFGNNPTSPYAPLDQQEITSTKILQDNEAIAAYGEKGKKGVVIITTKNGKPVIIVKKN